MSSLFESLYESVTSMSTSNLNLRDKAFESETVGACIEPALVVAIKNGLVYRVPFSSKLAIGGIKSTVETIWQNIDISFPSGFCIKSSIRTTVCCLYPSKYLGSGGRE